MHRVPVVLLDARAHKSPKVFFLSPPDRPKSNRSDHVFLSLAGLASCRRVLRCSLSNRVVKPSCRPCQAIVSRSVRRALPESNRASFLEAFTSR